MVASGQVVSFDTTVVDVDGESSTCKVTRVGLFNAVCDGKYLEYVSATGQFAFLPRQPVGRFTKTAKKVGLSLIHISEPTRLLKLQLWRHF